MRRWFMLCGLFFLLQTQAQARPSKPTGVGLIFGEPLGMIWKKWINRSGAFEGAVGYSFGGKDAVSMHIDYVVHGWRLRRLFHSDKGTLVFFFGPGLRLRTTDKDTFGLRGVIGATYILNRTPVDIFVQLVPIFDFIPGIGFSFAGGGGFRFFY